MFSNTPVRFRNRNRTPSDTWKPRKSVQWEESTSSNSHNHAAPDDNTGEIAVDGSRRHQNFYDYSEEQRMFEMIQSSPEKVTQMLDDLDFDSDGNEENVEEQEQDKWLMLESIEALIYQGSNLLRKGLTPALAVLFVCVFLLLASTAFSWIRNHGPKGFEPPSGLPKDFSEFSSRILKLELELSRVGSDSDSSSEWISANKAFLHDLPSKIEAVETALGGIDKQAEILSKSIERITKDTSFLMDDYSRVSSGQSKWVSELESLKAQLIKQRETINSIKTHEEETSPAVAILGSTVERIDGDLTRLLSDLEKRQKLDSDQISQLVTQAINKTTSVDESKLQIDEYIASVLPDIKSEVLEIVSSFSTLNETVDFSAVVSKVIEQRMAGIDIQSLVGSEELESSIQGVKKFVEEGVELVESAVGKVELGLTKVESDLSKVDNRIVEVEDQLTKMETEVTHVQSEVTRVKSNVSQVESHITQIKNNIEDMESKVDSQQYTHSLDNAVGGRVINYAALVHGARIDPDLTTSLYDPWKDRNSAYWALRSGLSSVGIGKPLVRRPWVALIADISGGSCWPFNGRKGQLAVKLAAKTRPKSFSLHHAADSEEDFSSGSAPRFFNIWVKVDNAKLREEIDSELENVHPPNIPEEFSLVGQFEFDPAITPNARYPVPKRMRKLAVETEEVIFEFVENWGHDKFTCVYQVGVHGLQAASEEIGDGEKECDS